MEKKEYLNIVETELLKAYIKIKNGDRSDLLSGKLFDKSKIRQLSEKDLWEARKNIKRSITTLNRLSENMPISEHKKDIGLKIALLDQMRFEIKEFMRGSERTL